MSKKWHSGPPPSIGWWPASMRKRPHTYRWWDGRRWSFAAYCYDSKDDAAMSASIYTPERAEQICWQTRPSDWPERSRT